MRELIFVSTNKHKHEEISKVLKEFDIKLKRKALDIKEPDLGSIQKVAEEKAKQAYSQLKKPLIVEDTGVFFDAYNEFPGLMAKRVYLGIGLKGLLKLLEGKKRTGYFGVALTYIWGKNKFKTFTGKLHGRFEKKIRNPQKNVLAYEKLFIPKDVPKSVPKGRKQTLSYFSREDKNLFSHRAIATRKFVKWFKKN